MEHSRACDLQENAACRERAHEAKVIQLQGEIDLLRREHVTVKSYKILIIMQNISRS